jgi:multidrug efflux system membrane fusion protein
MVVPVSVAVASQEQVPLQIKVVGNVEPAATVQIKSQVAGELVSVKFNEGANVNKGELLFQIDPRPYREALRQAEAGLARNVAQLKQAEANLARDQAQYKNAQAEATRYDRLAEQGVVSRAQHDQFRTNADALQQSMRADQAAMESFRASIESDRAAIEKAKLDLSYCDIRSPVSGRAGTLLVHAGNLVKANADNALVVINQVSPIFVSFNTPERYLPDIRQSSASRKLPVEVSPQDNPGLRSHGYLAVIDNAVDNNTGTVKLKALFTNEDRRLWPGQFVNVVLTLGMIENATVVPSEAIQASQDGQLIYVVKADQTVEPRKVQVGTTIEKRVVVSSGIKPGETVVTDGQMRLFPGALIKAVPASKIDGVL